jgi:hypothetical protein
MRTARGILVCCLLLAVSACSNNKGKIVGKWQCIDAGGVVPPGIDMKVEFTADGKFIMTLSGMGMSQSITAKYSLGMGDTVTFSDFSVAMPNGEKRARDDIKINGNDMTMKEPDGRVMKFKRI